MVGAPGEGLRIALRTLDHTRVTIGAQAVGIAQGALDFAVGYAKERSQFGKHIAEFQGIQFMLADMAMKLEAARQMVYVAAAKSERGDADLPFFGAAAKCYASDVAMEVTTDAVQLLGGAGYVKDFPVERMMRDAKITQIYEGTNQIQRLVMARSSSSRALAGVGRPVGHGGTAASAGTGAPADQWARRHRSGSAARRARARRLPACIAATRAIGMVCPSSTSPRSRVCGGGIKVVHGSASPSNRGTVVMVNSAGDASARSSHANGNDTGTPGRTLGL